MSATRKKEEAERSEPREKPSLDLHQSPEMDLRAPEADGLAEKLQV